MTHGAPDPMTPADLQKLAKQVADDVKHRDNDLPTVLERAERLLTGLRAEAGEQSEDTSIVNRVTEVVRTADRDFERVGGSSRHWVRDCFLPTLNAAGLEVRALAAPLETPQGEKRRHYCGASERLTACGRQRNKLTRGSTAFEWNYVNCDECLKTRPAAPSSPTGDTP